MRFISSSFTISSSFFARQSGSESGSLVSSSYNINVHKDIGGLEPDFANRRIEFIIPSQSAGGANDVKVLTISASGINPRVGIGTDDPKGVFDFKDVEDTTKGAELLLRSARSSVGGQVGDEGGTINFIIDSSSFSNLKTTGSLAKIKTKVTSISTGGAQGKLTLELSKGGTTNIDAFEYGFNIGGQALFASVQTASLVMKDFSSGGESIFQMRDFDDNVRFEVNDGLLYASGNISSSGDVIANNITASNLDISGDVDIDGTLEADAITVGGTALSSVIAGTSVALAASSVNTTNANIVATTDDADFFVTMVDGATGNQRVESSTKLKFNPSNGNLFVDGHITASGAISASGTIFTDTLSSPSNNLSIPTDTVTITAGTAGDANLILHADTDNSEETDNPYMLYRQDGATGMQGMIGLTAGPNVWPDGSTLTGATGNSMVIGMLGAATNQNRQVIIAAADSASIVVKNNADVQILENLIVDNHITASGDISASGILSIPGFTNVSASLAAATAGGGTITGVTAGTGLSGGGTAGTVTLNIGQDVATTADVQFANITSSGNISASGDLSALDLNLFGGGLSIKNQGAQSYARFYCESNNAHYTEIKAQEHANFSGNVTLLLPAYDFDFASPIFSTNISASNLSGTNTGDQDLSGLALKTAISGAFTAASASFSTRVTANDAKLTANTSNVQSAGALMDSELAEIATVKALTKAGISGSFTVASASFSTRVTANDAKLTADTSNVTSAGALMDSELSEIATVKALTKVSISGSFTATSASFSTRVTANDAKLTANTSNVTSAGALMDSELSNLAAVKAINQGLTTTSNVTFNDIDVDGTLTIPGFANVSSSLAAAVAGGDNLGNHTATQDINLDSNSIKNVLHITASGDISASGFIYSDRYYVGGHLGIAHSSGQILYGYENNSPIQIGKSSNPTNIRGHITASGNISASGFISASTFVGDGSGLTGLSSAAITTYNNSGDNRILTSVNSTTVNSEANLTFDGSGLSVTGHITASSNISSSNTTYTKFLRLPQTAASAGEGAIYFGSALNGNNGYIYDDGNNLQLGYNDSDILQVNNSTPQVAITGDLKVFGGGAGTITATGNISASGNFLGAQLKSHDKIVGLYHAGSDTVRLANPTTPTRVYGTSINLTEAPVTASIISASGTITGNSIVGTLATAAQTNITSVGTLGSLTMGGDIDMDGNTLDLNGGEINGGLTISSATFMLGNGTAANPSLSFTADTNTGIYLAGADTMLLQAGGGTGELLINTSGVSVNNGNLTYDIHKLSKTTTGVANHNGADVVFFGGTTSMDNGKIYYYNGSGGWTIANADALADSKGLLAVALGAASDTNGMLIKGMVTLDHDPGAVADVLYLSTTDGQASSTAPSGNNHVVRTLGYCLDASNGQIYFNPSSDFIVITA